MPTVRHARKEVFLKIVYYGPGLGGKTTNLQYLHARARPEHKGKLISMETDAERTLFFDLMPVELGVFKGYTIRLHLCTVPGQIVYDQTRRVILRAVDGVVFVVDSQPEAIEANVESIRNLENNLRLQGQDPDRLPLVVQYNKRDLPSVLPISELREWLNIPRGLPELEASARTGLGVSATLKRIVKECLLLVGDPRSAAEGRTPSILPGARPSMFPGGSPGQARASIPAAPPLPGSNDRRGGPG
jgi:signal recognition particle receptor subunit beta